MLANIITLSRLLLTFIVIGMFGKHNVLNFLLIGAIYEPYEQTRFQ